MGAKRKLVGAVGLIRLLPYPPTSPNIERLLMQSKTELLAKQLVRHFVESRIKGVYDQEACSAMLQDAFTEAIRSRINKLVEKKKKDVAEDFTSFLGKAIGHSAAHVAASGLNVKTSTITGLVSTLRKSKKPKQKKTKSAVGSEPQAAPERMSADQYRKEMGLPPRGSKNEELLTIAEIRRLKQKGGIKCKK